MFRDDVRLKKVAALFDAVLDLDETAREQWLKQHCSDAEIHTEVLALCRADDSASGLLDIPVGHLANALIEEPQDRASAMLDMRIGAWKVTALLGEGGMATVWLGERCDGRFEQQVAIKCLKVALAGPDLERRFRRERQILANLEHPGIARLLDGGVSEDGVPYIVMERVRGESLIKASDTRGLNLVQRLRLFAGICDIVQYAHQQLVVHRDLKPANILIDEQGRPRLLDFGIAGLLNDAAVDNLATRSLALTPAYAAPEQIKGRPVGVAADIYALGVILCELVTGGQRPAVASDEELAASQAQWPSRLVLADPQHDAAWAKQRSHSLRGDVDAIASNCLRWQPEQRYASVAHLAWDVRNHLLRRPVSARRGRLGYRVMLFVRRHSAALTAVAMVLAVLLGALGYSVHQNRRTEAALDESRAVQDFLTSLFESTLPAGAASALPDTRELLDRGAERARTDFGDNPQLRTRMLVTIGKIYRRLGQFDEAQELLDEAVASGELKAHAVDQAASLDLRREVALLQADKGQLAEAATLLEEVLAERRRQGAQGTTLVSALRELGKLRSELGKHEQAVGLQSEALAVLQRDGRSTLAELADTRSDLGAALLRSGEHAQAIATLRIALEEKIRAFGSVHESVNVTASNLAAALRREEQYEEAERLLREVVDTDARIYTTPHSKAAQHLNNLGTSLDFAGHPLEAREYLQRARDMNVELFGLDHPRTAIAISNLAGVEYKLGHNKIAVVLQREVLKQFVASYGAEHYNVAVAQNNLARSLVREGEWGEATHLADASLKLKQELRGTNDGSIAPALATLALIDRDAGRLEAAHQRLEQLLQLDGMDQRRDSPGILDYRTDLAEVRCMQGHHAEALALLDTILASSNLVASRAPLHRARTLYVQGNCLARQGHHEQARAVWREAQTLREGRLPVDFPHSRDIRE